MAQFTTGIRSVLNSPRIYDFFQDLMGAQAGRLNFVQELVRPEAGCAILDIGCGTARILDFLPPVEYYGFDLSQRYLNDAQRRYRKRGHFHCAAVEKATIDQLPQFDIVISIGLLHHLDDEQAHSLIRLAHSALKAGGRLVTLDPCYSPDQSRIARLLVSQDRGQNVRTGEEYRKLAKGIFSKVSAKVRHRNWIPYTHCLMECEK